jgi:hypothetical protein
MKKCHAPKGVALFCIEWQAALQTIVEFWELDPGFW